MMWLKGEPSWQQKAALSHLSLQPPRYLDKYSLFPPKPAIYSSPSPSPPFEGKNGNFILKLRLTRLRKGQDPLSPSMLI